ncbi:MFS transporter [Salinirubellus sp. GCM10025818]|uniref:MFS transporter n=1 Tax=Salinirubellus TaxID=2162630 RepID=UPI0030D60110
MSPSARLPSTLRAPTRWRWVLWAALAGGFLLVNFHRVSTGVLSGPLARTFDTTGAELGFLHASFFYIYAALQLPSGLLVDRFGSRRVAAVGLLCMSAGVVGFAVSGSFLAAFLSRAVVGLGGSVLFIATLRFLANWYRPREFATMTGLTAAAAGVGGVLATTPLALAVEATGWRDSMLAAALVGFAFTLGVGVLVRDRPSDAGFDPIDGVTPPEGFPDLGTVAANTRRVLAAPSTWLLGFVLFFLLGTNFTVLGLWGVPYIVHLYDVSVPLASNYVLLGNLGLLVGGPTIGWLSDRLGRRVSLMFAAVCTFVLAYAVIFLTVTPPLAVVGLVLFAANFTAGGNLLAYAVVKERHSAAASGTVTGTVNSIGYFGAAVFPAAMGAVLDAYWTGETVAGARIYTALGYRVAFGIATLAGLLSLACLTWFYLRYGSGSATETQAEAVED